VLVKMTIEMNIKYNIYHGVRYRAMKVL